MNAKAGYRLPLAYYVDFLRFLRQHDDRIEIITYDDLPWGEDRDWEHFYPREYQAWRQQAEDRVYLLIQHDVDSDPQRTIEMLQAEQALGIRSNVMVFNKRINRRLLQDCGEVELTGYPLDDDYLRQLQAEGFVIGYHSNAFERAGFDADAAADVFADDIAALRRRFEIRYFSPHGGVRDPQGNTNNKLPVPESLRSSLRWVHNRFAPRFNSSYSDGGISRGYKPLATFDLRHFIASCRPGERHRILIHPQYIGYPAHRDRYLAGMPWYERVFAEYNCERMQERAEPAPMWREVRPARKAPRILGKLTRAVSRLTRKQDSYPRIEQPVFVRGLSRSGGTLTVTLLDAHPDISMSYELYPSLLLGQSREHPEKAVSQESDDYREPGFSDRLKARMTNALWLARRLQNRNLRTYFARCARGGLAHAEVASMYNDHLRAGFSFGTLHGCLKFVERCAVEKMQKLGGKVWGLKCSSQFEAYHALWPQARFIDIVRDPRDVLASQLHTGSFNPDPQDLGRVWQETHDRFDAFAESSGAAAYQLSYERLVTHAEDEVRALCGFLELPFDRRMLQFHSQDLTIYGASHLSMERISKPVDSSRVGRWKKDLDQSQLDALIAVAGDGMRRHGYLEC